MTVITKPNTILKKEQLRLEAEAAAAAAAAAYPEKSDNAIIYFDEEETEAIWPWQRLVRVHRTVRVMAAVAVILLLVVGGMAVYQHCSVAGHRYRAFCAVPVPRDQKGGAGPVIQSNYQQMPALRWSSGPDPDIQVFSTLDDDASRELITYLRESLDIQADVEKITVFDNGKRVNFIHDFTENVTNIVDMDRCFSMDLDPEYTLSPEVFTLSIERGDSLDTSVVRSVWRAMLPPLQQLASWAKPLCKDKPAYKLQREAVVIRKRSADEPSHEFMHFAGNHVMAIAIDNLAEIKNFEMNRKEN